VRGGGHFSGANWRVGEEVGGNLHEEVGEGGIRKVFGRD
jgi:hypothetical protein